MDSVIYFFSATGNSLKVAKDISSKLGNTKLIKICKDTLNTETEKKYKRIGIIFPVYYYGLPLMVEEFVKKLEIDEDTYVYAVATCGGSVGSAINSLKEILNHKSVTLSAAFTVIMPDNYQVMYSPPSLEKQKKLFKLQEEKIQHIYEIILKGVKSTFEENNSFPAKLIGKMLSKSFKPKDKDKNFWSDEKCNSCRICSKVCPSNNIIFEQNKPKWLHQCEHCLACMHWCPKKSIQYKRGTLKRERYHHPQIKVNELIYRE
jgi:flavodoxin/Pyruvate/2-oxoacid:ferredoxin oxidoreductase delta subunit